MSRILNQARKILVVDDDDDNRILVSKALSWEGYTVDVAENGEVALAKLQQNGAFHLVLMDVNMPGLSGLETLRLLRRSSEYVSVIMVTAQSGTDDVVRGLDLGADDYIRKPFAAAELLARVRAQLRIKDLNDQLKVANARLQELVDHDDLTGLFNMRHLYEKLDMELARGRRFARPVGVVMMDMDNFKQVNDHHDHLFGSHVLSEVGKLIRENIRQVDFAARYGGDEFLLVLCETSTEGARLFAERLRSIISNYEFTSDGYSMRLTASLGLAVTQGDSSQVDARTLVRSADRALYTAKESGKNCVRIFDLAAEGGSQGLEDPVKLRKRKLAG